MSYKVIKLFLIHYLVNSLLQIFIIVANSQWQTVVSGVCVAYVVEYTYLTIKTNNLSI